MALATDLQELTRILEIALEEQGPAELEQRVFELAAVSTPRRNALILTLAAAGWRQAEEDGCFRELEEAFRAVWDGAALALRIRVNGTDPALL